MTDDDDPFNRDAASRRHGPPKEPFGQPPRWRAPALACDAHVHLVGPFDRFPLPPPHEVSDLPADSAVPASPLADYLVAAARLGVERFVVVQPRIYGRDNRCALDAVTALGADRCRAVIDLDEETPDAELERLHLLGVRGVRIRARLRTPPGSGLAEALTPRIRRLDARCAERGWLLDFVAPGWMIDAWMPLMQRLRSRFSVAHMGMFPAADGPRQPGVVALLDLLRYGEGRCWIKLTGPYRTSHADGFADTRPIVEALIGASPDRLVWGSDYPHLSLPDPVGSPVEPIRLFDLLGDWAASDNLRRRILVQNPAELYGFGR